MRPSGRLARLCEYTGHFLMSTFHINVNSTPRWSLGGPAGNTIPLRPTTFAGPVGRVRETQRSMWPNARPGVPGLDYHAGWRTGLSPAALAGTLPSVDYLDYFEMDGGHFGFAIGEVLGGEATGEAATPQALLLSSLHSLVRSLGARPTIGLGDMIHSIHELFYDTSPAGGYATLFLARYDPIGRRLDYCNAGHEAPLLLRKAGVRRRTILLEHGGPMVGVLRRSAFRQGSILLQPGDILAAFTSGLTETLNARGEEWGSRRMAAAIEETSRRPASEIVEHVFAEAHGFSYGARSTRDMTLWLGRMADAGAGVPELETVAEEPEEAAVLAA
jgi:phosphoserine phosphatase RsbU/P